MKRVPEISNWKTLGLTGLFMTGLVVLSDMGDRLINLLMHKQPRMLQSDFNIRLATFIVLGLIGGIICWIAFLGYQEFLQNRKLKFRSQEFTESEIRKALTSNVETYAGFVFLEVLILSIVYRLFHLLDRELTLILTYPCKALFGVLFGAFYAFYIGYVYRGYLKDPK